MSVVSYKTEVSHRYYARKRKSEIVRRIRDLRETLSRVGIDVAESMDATLSAPDFELQKLAAGELAWLAIRLHSYFPDDAP